ncbi:hypothetical protein IAT40_002728 [Kwoniella sp. CBS 6097]
MPRMASKRAWLLLAASVTLHLIILSSTKIIGDRTATTPGRRLVRRYVAAGDPSYSTTDVLLDLPYSEWYENMPPALKLFYILILLFILAFLFSFIGISASDFFCPNLSTIASYLGLNESTAGVTFLAFGNGSPDVFSTFSAMKGGTFGLAVGELIGAATFITSIVVGSIAFIRPFHVPRHAFLRDVLFFTAAVIVLMVVLRDGHLSLWESSGMVALYLAYVGVVVGGNWWGRRKRRKAAMEVGSSHSHKSPKLNGGSSRGGVSSIHSSPFLSPVPQPIPDADDVPPVETPGQLTPTTPRPHMGRTRSHTSASHLGGRPSHFPLHHHDSIDTPRANFSLLGAIEFRDVVNSLRKESNSREGSPNRSPLREGEQGDYFGPAAASAYGHRRSSSYGFSAALQGGPGVRRTTSMKGNRRRASTHTSPTEREGPRSVSTPAPAPAPAIIPAPPARSSLGVSPEPNPWEDQTGHPPTPMPPFSEALESPKKPDRPKVLIPGSSRKPNQAARPIVPSIALVDPSGHTGVPTSDHPTPPTTPPLPKTGHTESRFAIRRRSKLILRVLFPSLQSFRHKSIIGMVLAVTSVPAILVLTLTLPVVDDGGQNDEGGVALPIGEGEGLTEAADWEGDDDDDDRTLSDSSSQFEEGEDEADRLLLPEIGEELHHLVDHGFSPLHSPLGRISHAALRRASEHIEAGGEVGMGDVGAGDDEENVKEEVYEEIEEERGLQYNKYLTAAQCVFGPTFCAFIIFGDESYLPWVLLGTSVAGLAAAAVVLYLSTDGSSYTWRLVRCFCGFICSMVWIAAIADEVVGVLNTVGEILGLSDAIIGLTIFAIGNSLADLVANVTVAQFAPAMAYAACFGGPMLNLLLGVGGSGTYHILFTPSHKPVTVHFSPTLWVSAGGLVLILLATAVVVPMNGYLIDRRWAGALIVGYLVLMVVNVVVEIKTGRG